MWKIWHYDTFRECNPADLLGEIANYTNLLQIVNFNFGISLLPCQMLEKVNFIDEQEASIGEKLVACNFLS